MFFLSGKYGNSGFSALLATGSIPFPLHLDFTVVTSLKYNMEDYKLKRTYVENNSWTIQVIDYSWAFYNTQIIY